ncbi:MAG TPA: phosphotransferase [Gemmataceae bacterium]|jgi:hypothetical protein|nr:phosphotransferase [Gemmataceae bacterium]
MMHWLSQDGRTPEEPGNVLRFAANFADGELRFGLWLVTEDLRAGSPKRDLPAKVGDIAIECQPDGKVEPVTPGSEKLQKSFNVSFVVPKASPTATDDEVEFDIIAAAGSGIRPCHIVLRRTRCRVETTLVEQQTNGDLPSEEERNALAHCRAALQWYGHKRYQKIVGLKRFTSGRSGSNVFVFRPQLVRKGPHNTAGESTLESTPEAWGSYLLVKTGPVHKIAHEWQRFCTYLVDQQHPFMARSEELLSIGPEGEQPSARPLATVVGSFLGGDLLRVEPFEQLMLSSVDAAAGRSVVEKLFAVLATWHAGAEVQPLGKWKKMFVTPEKNKLLLLGKFNFAEEEGRRGYAESLAWDISFYQEKHLSGHLLGKDRKGLLYQIMELPARFSLIHGDMHPRNVLADRDNVWLLDFGETGMGPTLFDFTKLEVYLRLWCLIMEPAGGNFEAAARELETRLLDHMTGTESGLGYVPALAKDLGARPDDLLRVTECIAAIRRQATPYCVGGPDRRDYVAVLFLTILYTLRYASSDASTAHTENFRLLMSLYWVLEDVLSRLLGVPPFQRQTQPLELHNLLLRRWLEAPGAPQRVAYFLEREEGRTALAPLAATQGVLQNAMHHLDVFDHTLVVLAYLEALLETEAGFPLRGFLDHVALDRQVERTLAEQGFRFPALAQSQRGISLVSGSATPAAWMTEVQQPLQQLLTPETKLWLKWAALFHDVGKPATRGVNTTGAGAGERVSFLGHERYGRQLVTSHLRHLYPEQELRSRLIHVIDKHHVHLQLAKRYFKDKPESFESVLHAAREREMPEAAELHFLEGFWDPAGNPYAADFPLLILHGYADALACRGPEAVTPVHSMAELDLALLRLFFLYQSGDAGRQRTERLRALMKGLNTSVKIKGPALGLLLKQVESWGLAEMERRAANGGGDLSRDELVAKAQELAAKG